MLGTCLSGSLEVLSKIPLWDQDSGFLLFLLVMWEGKLVTATHTYSCKEIWSTMQSECDHPPPHFRFNSHRARLEDPISGDIEPGAQWNGTPGRPNHSHCSALLREANQIPSRQSRWSISSSPFSRWDYLLCFWLHGLIFAATYAILLTGCAWLMLSFPCCQATWAPKCTIWGWAHDILSVVPRTSHPALYMTFKTL